LSLPALSAAPPDPTPPRAAGSATADICPEDGVIPAEKLSDGAPPGDPHRQNEEQPQHKVNIAYAFAVGRFEVTRDEYTVFVSDTRLAEPEGCNVHEPPRWLTIMGLSWHNTGFPQTGRDPVGGVSWMEARAYASWLSHKTGHTYRLLSEASGSTPTAPAPIYRRTGEMTRMRPVSTPTASMPRSPSVSEGKVGGPSPLSRRFLCLRPRSEAQNRTHSDCTTWEGNAFEWVEDCLSDDYQGAPTEGSARTEAADCNTRVNRGGSWTSIPTGLRAAHRGADHISNTRVVDLGFRVARDL